MDPFPPQVAVFLSCEVGLLGLPRGLSAPVQGKVLSLGVSSQPVSKTKGLGLELSVGSPAF